MKVEKKTLQKPMKKKLELEPVYDCVAVNSRNEQKYVYIISIGFGFICRFLHMRKINLTCKMTSDTYQMTITVLSLQNDQKKTNETDANLKCSSVNHRKKNDNNNTRTSFFSLAYALPTIYSVYIQTNTHTNTK